MLFRSSGVGDRCVGAKVNGRIVPLTTKLENGDQVEIITSKTQTPSPTWERFVITGKARSHIRKFVRQQQRNEYATLGRAMLQKMFRQEGYEFSDKACKGALEFYKLDDVEDLLASLGSGHRAVKDVFYVIFPGHKPKADEPLKPEDVLQKSAENAAKLAARKKDKPIEIKGLIPGMAVHYARCCHPLPGDRIVGIVSTGKGVTIHTIDCETLESFAETPERWLDVSWGDDVAAASAQLNGRLNLTVLNEAGGLGGITTIIGKNGGNIINIKFTTRSTDFYEMYIDVQVKDARQLNDIIAALRASAVVTDVERARTS